MCVCVCVCDCVCVCVCERERERENEKVFACVREWERQFRCDRVCKGEKERV